MKNNINREKYKKIAQDTVEIINNGGFWREQNFIDMTDDIDYCIYNTREFDHKEEVFVELDEKENTKFFVLNVSTIDAIEKFNNEKIIALNFASAVNPGGGFLNGSNAQEESLARASALYGCLEGSPMYYYNRNSNNFLYLNWAIVSPRVPIFKKNNGEIRDKIIYCSFISSPAPNVHRIVKENNSLSVGISDCLHERIDKILSICAYYKFDTLVLGAWGCGVFKNNPTMVAKTFKYFLFNKYNNVFKNVIFAILDYTKDKQIINSFYKVFEEGEIL